MNDLAYEIVISNRISNDRKAAFLPLDIIRAVPVTTIRGVKYIDDHRSNNINSVWYAVESVNQPIVLILGGDSRDMALNEWAGIKEVLKEKVKAIVVICDVKALNTPYAAIIRKTFKDDVDFIEESGSIEKAVKEAYYITKPGDAVVFSPGCTSKMKDRSEQFRKAVYEL